MQPLFKKRHIEVEIEDSRGKDLSRTNTRRYNRGVQLGNEENFLRIESKPLYGSNTLLKIEAVATASGCRFTAVHDRIVIDSSEETKKRFADFTTLNTVEFELLLSEGGWIRLKRDVKGYVVVGYRIADWKASAAMEVEIIVEGEFTQQLYNDIAALLRGKL